MVLLSILFIFLLLYAWLFFSFWKGWKLAGSSRGTAKTFHFISVIVAARNEEANISILLEALKAQSFPSRFFEVIIVDDFSTDATASMVTAHTLEQLHLVQPATTADRSSKKKAIEAGISKAKGELIVTTDADCIPGTRWLETIHDLYAETGASFIAAPVKFSHNRSLLELFQSIDFLTMQGITASSVATRRLTMCNGANLAYTKKAFEEVNGFSGIDRVATGDDMLLMYKIWKQDPSKVFYQKNRDAIVVTQPMKTWKDFLMQRKRWASKTLIYDDKRILAVLVFVYLFNCLFPLLIVASFFHAFYLWYVLAFWIVKVLIEFPFVRSVADFYDEKKLLRPFVLLQPLHIFYMVFIGFISQFGKYEWKGRRTK